MQRLTPYGWFSVTCFVAGVLLGSLAIGFMLLTSSPVPIGATLIAFAVAFSPVCLMALLISRIIPMMGWLLAPSLTMAGLAVPLDFAFACLLGSMSERALQLTIVALTVIAILCLRKLLDPTTVRMNIRKFRAKPAVSPRAAFGTSIQ